MRIFTKQTVLEFWHVLIIIFPLTLIIPRMMMPLLEALSLSVASLLATLLIDIVIVGLAVFIFLPALNKLTSKYFS
jgi:antibiotic biosynthesis monooxygenase (ABM) superfamily enzyme|tara:strand:- start:213 stop:440 length:228 start_codon:yes stop_codon:yes gene_type:complete